jgi:hypothetical protein
MCISEAENTKTRDLYKTQSRDHKNMRFEEGERIDIIAKGNKGRKGAFLGTSGFLSAKIQIDGDSRGPRTLRLTSLRAIATPTLVARTGSPDLGQTNGDLMQELLEEARDIELRMRNLILRLEATTILLPDT